MNIAVETKWEVLKQKKKTAKRELLKKTAKREILWHENNKQEMKGTSVASQRSASQGSKQRITGSRNGNEQAPWKNWNI